MEVKYLALQQLQMRSATLESPTYLKTKHTTLLSEQEPFAFLLVAVA